jgi:uncharacterized membrane protein YccC
MRTLRAVLVIPGLFALTFEGLGNLQMALFAAFGGFATLVMASFGGSRRDKAIAHLGLALTGSVGLIIGTAVHKITWLAVIVTIPVAFGIFFAGVAGPNAASGVTAALLGYVLPVATPGTMSMIGDRLAGWWLAAAVGTAAVLLLSPPPPGDRLRAAAAASARALAAFLDSSVRGTATAADFKASQAAKHELLNAFSSTPYRPTGLATADQGLASVVQLLEWCTSLVADATDGHPNLDSATPQDRELLAAAASALEQVGRLLAQPGTDAPDCRADALLSGLAEIDRLREAAVADHRLAAADGDNDPADRDTGSAEAVVRQAFYAHTIGLVVRNIVADTLIATRRADPETIAARRRSWYGAPAEGTAAERRAAALVGAAGVITRHASFRSVWFLNSLRGSLALALAVLVADVSGAQHAFWVVLGALSVLRTNASGTESTALRALGGTVVGFVVGALLLLGIGTSTPALWAALPIAIAVAAYAPGTLPFAFGQAAFTVVVVVLFNLLVPVGWTVGLLRIEDVALGCAVSVVIGFLFWPRGAGGLVGDDLADAFRAGAAYLTQAVDWALGTRQVPPDSGPAAATAGIRLDEALRGFLSEQGAKRMSKEELWMLVLATMRLRLTAYALAGQQEPEHTRHRQHQAAAYARAVLTQAAADLAGFYERIAELVGRPVPRQVLPPITVPAVASLDGSDTSAAQDGSVGTDDVKVTYGANGADGDGDTGQGAPVRVVTGQHHRRLLWVHENLQDLSSHARGITGPAMHVAEQRRVPWWR